MSEGFVSFLQVASFDAASFKSPDCCSLLLADAHVD